MGWDFASISNHGTNYCSWDINAVISILYLSLCLCSALSIKDYDLILPLPLPLKIFWFERTFFFFFLDIFSDTLLIHRGMNTVFFT